MFYFAVIITTMHLQLGNILKATSLIDDPVFVNRSVILNQESSEGMYGFIINHPLDVELHQIDQSCHQQNIAIYNGGPVGLDEIGFLHCRYDLFPESKQLNNEICWGGYFDKLVDLINKKIIAANEFSIFKGYCGWDIDQILQEVYEEKSWEILIGDKQNVFQKKI